MKNVLDALLATTGVEWDDEENAAAELSEGASNGAGAGGEEDDGITEADLREVEALVAHAHDEQWASFQSRLARDFSSIAVFTCACTLPADRIAETGCAYAEEFAWAHVGS